MNLSDHLPILTTLCIPCTRTRTRDPKTFKPKSRWKDEMVKTRYREALPLRLRPNPINPDGGSETLAVNIDTQISEISTSMHAAALEAGCLPSRFAPPKKWWCPELGRLRDCLRLWRLIWISNNHLRGGTIFECYKHIKHEYRKACRTCAHPEIH